MTPSHNGADASPANPVKPAPVARRVGQWGRAARPARDLFSAEAFAEWLAEARMGEWVCYHRGAALTGAAGRKAPAAIAAAEACDDGLVTMALRRLPDGGFEFLCKRIVRGAA